MHKDLEKISDVWKEMYSRRIMEYRSFDISEDFKKFASIFSPGNSYYYVVNMHNLEVEFMSESVKQFIDIQTEAVTMRDLLETILPEEIENIGLKSKVISDFYTSFLDQENVLNYKNMFSYRMKDKDGNIRTMLYQAFPLNVLENGTPEHVFCTQTDVSHLRVPSTNSVSFMHITGGKNYYNVDTSKGKFDPENIDGGNHDFSKLLTDREKEILIKLAKGLNAEQIAEQLNLSPHTIKTHRRNFLNKTGCTNTTELVAKCLTNGIISPSIG